MQVTIFKDIKDTSQPFYRDVSVVLKRIEDGSSKELVKEIRKTKDKEERNNLKKRLPAICFSGKFNKRNDSSLIEHSGLICLDFDGYKLNKEMLQEKERLCKNKFIYSVFISPSGKGLKALVKIPPNVDNHKSYFNSLQKHINSPHFDTTSKNVSRVCYESYDPLIYISKNSKVWDKVEEKEYVEKIKLQDKPTIPLTDENKIVDILVKWWDKKYGLVSGERNNNVYVLAAAFNDFGIDKNLAIMVMSNFESKDFSRAEILRTISSAYANTHNFGTKYYEDEDKVNVIKQQLRKGVDKHDIKCHIKNDKISDENLEEVIVRLQEEQTENKFWTKSKKGNVKIIPIYYKNFLEDSGFYKFNPTGSKNFVFVRVINNLIDHTSEKEIKDFVLNHLLDLDDISVYNYFAENTRYFREDFLTLLSSIDVFFIEDTKDTAYLYFLNCAVKITQNEINLIDYLDLGGYVWKDHVIDREFTLCHVQNCDYKTFINI